MINIKIDSRKVTKGDTFVAIRGFNVDGHSFINKAIENGATRVVVDRDVDCSIEVLKVKDTKQWLTNYISKNYADEVNEMDIYGVTGTNGKTSTAYFTYQMFNLLGKKAAYIGTIGFYLPDGTRTELPNSTPDILDTYELLLTAKEMGAQSVVMELSSHGLAEKRVKGIKFKGGAFTNLTHDHLDFHKTMKRYLNAKMLFLKQLEGPIVINVDDPYSKYWIQKYDKCITLGKCADDYTILNYERIHAGTRLRFKASGIKYELEINLIGLFNVYNFLTSLAIVHLAGYPLDDILKIAKDVYPPPGRCDVYKVGDAEVVIDYAHTPDAMEKILDVFSSDVKGRLICLFGCPGERDRTKRPVMGHMATTRCDYVFVTTDNPAKENVDVIIGDILSGIKADNYEVELDRRKAVSKALKSLEKGDVLLLLGKGHENYQIVGTEKIHYDDTEEVKNYINNMKNANK